MSTPWTLPRRFPRDLTAAQSKAKQSNTTADLSSSPTSTSQSLLEPRVRHLQYLLSSTRPLPLSLTPYLPTYLPTLLTSTCSQFLLFFTTSISTSSSRSSLLFSSGPALDCLPAFYQLFFYLITASSPLLNPSHPSIPPPPHQTLVRPLVLLLCFCRD